MKQLSRIITGINLKTPLFLLFLIFNILLMINLVFERMENSTKFQKLTESNINTKKSEINGFIYESSHVQINALNDSATPILCLYVSQLQCRPCVDTILIQFYQYCLENPTIKFSILCNHYNDQDFNLFNRIHKISNSSLLFEVNNNEGSIFQASSPVIFIYNPIVSKAELVFFPNKLDIDRTWKFLEIVKYRYFP